MKNWKSIGSKLLFLPLCMILILAVFSAAALITVFVQGMDMTLIAYVIYVVSFYTLTVICIACWKTIPGYYKTIKGKVYNNKYANRYLTDAVFKTHVNLYRSLTINLIYVTINAVSAIVYRTHWFGVVAVYYAIMAMMHFLLVRYVGHNKIGSSWLGELKRSRLCAYILMTVNLALTGTVLMMVFFNRGFEYRGFLIYVIALYTFCITTTAIVDMNKYRKYKSPVMSMAKIIKMASALFSILFLETAMFSQFGGDTSPKTQQIMIMATGAGISMIVVAMAGYMIRKSSQEISEYKN